MAVDLGSLDFDRFFGDFFFGDFFFGDLFFDDFFLSGDLFFVGDVFLFGDFFLFGDVFFLSGDLFFVGDLFLSGDFFFNVFGAFGVNKADVCPRGVVDPLPDDVPGVGVVGLGVTMTSGVADDRMS